MNRKLLLAIDSLGLGGAERNFTSLAFHLPKDWKCSVFTMGGGHFLKTLKENQMNVFLSKRRFTFDPAAILDFYSMMKEIRPDVVHSWGWMTGFAAAVSCKLLSIPHIEGSIQMGMFPLEKKYRRRILSHLGDLTVANSMAGLEAWKINLEKGRVLHNGLDFSRFEHSNIITEQIYQDRFIIVMVASMSHFKDYDTVIKTMHILNNDYTLIGIGDGPNRERLLMTSESLRKAGDIVFPGRVPKVVPYLKTADIGVLMSTQGEGISNTILEYMYSGLPVICSDNPGSRELIEDGKTGFLISPGDEKALAEKIEWVRNHPEQAKTMGRNARKVVLEEYSMTRMVSKAIEIYEEAISMRT